MMENEITIDVSDIKTERLEQCLDSFNMNPEELSKNIIKAAADEYFNMITGDRSYSRVDDIKEYRLFLLIKHVFCFRIPDDQQICNLLQVKLTKAQSMLRNVITKYKLDLDMAIEESIRELLKNAMHSKSLRNYSITGSSSCLLDEMNQALAMSDAELSPIRKKPNTTLIYLIDENTYLKLCELYYKEENQLTEMKARHYLLTSSNGTGAGTKQIFTEDEAAEALLNDYINSVDPALRALTKDANNILIIENDTYNALCVALDLNNHSV